MSPQHPSSGANAEAAAPRVREAGSSPTPSAPSPDAPGAPEAKATTTPTGTTPAASTPTGTTAAPEAESASTPTAKTAAAPPSSSASTAAKTTKTAKSSRTTEAPEEGVGVAAAVGTAAPGVKTATGVDGGRPRKPVLAGAAIVGAVLIAVPLLLAGGADDKERGDSAKERLTAQGSDTVLNPDSSAAVDDYVAQKPSASPAKEKPKKSEAPKVVAPQPPAPMPATSAPKPKASSSPTKKPKPKPKPKATPKPNWSTETVSATSVLEVNQAWTTNRIRMVMQTDGNLVVYNEEGKPIWASMTFGQNHRAIFQTDGNLVIHNGDDRPIWASQTWGNEGAQLVLRADAKVTIVNNGRVVWST
ncbi:mannose-binding protein [Streptomyces cellulosae]|uniref:Mannose-binding protein n=1 Tax=Streptomyces cellulosae TaxID=1968 RepID=A0ABW7XWS7_STRCE